MGSAANDAVGGGAPPRAAPLQRTFRRRSSTTHSWRTSPRRMPQPLRPPTQRPLSQEPQDSSLAGGSCCCCFSSCSSWYAPADHVAPKPYRRTPARCDFATSKCVRRPPSIEQPRRYRWRRLLLLLHDRRTAATLLPHRHSRRRPRARLPHLPRRPRRPRVLRRGAVRHVEEQVRLGRGHLRRVRPGHPAVVEPEPLVSVARVPARSGRSQGRRGGRQGPRAAAARPRSKLQ